MCAKAVRMRHFRKLTLPAMPSARCKMCLRPRGAPRSVRARARMSVSEVRKAGSSDMRRPKQYRLNVEHITRYRRTPKASRLKEKRGCLKSWLLFRQPVEFKIKSLYCKDLILNIAYKIKEAVQKLKFLDSRFNNFY